MTIELQAPNRELSDGVDIRMLYSVFLGGSIEMGKATHWQKRLLEDFSHVDDHLVFLNPRRDDWDSSWVQDPTPGSKFNEQVTWEIDMQEIANLIIYYFDPGTISPITLLELGLYKDKNTVVCCSPEYARYGNVKIVCERYNIKIVESYDELVNYLKGKLER